jgi:hypothetical protein
MFLVPQFVPHSTRTNSVAALVNFDLTHKNLDAENWLPPMFNDLPEKPVNARLVSVVRSTR